MSKDEGNVKGNMRLALPVQLDGRGDLDDILERLALHPAAGWMEPAVVAQHIVTRAMLGHVALVEPDLDPKPKTRKRPIRAECFPFPDMR